jgi:hypothetical protein
MERKTLSGETVYDGKIRWVLTVDLVGPTEEAILNDINSQGDISPEIEEFVSNNVGWNLSAEEI